MKIHLSSVGIPVEWSAITDFVDLAARSRHGRHELVDSPSDADACLFTECHQLGDPITLSRVQRTEVFRRFRTKCFVYDQRPRAYCSIPGVVSSVPKSLIRPDFQLAWGYHHIDDPNALLDPDDAAREPDLLFSFVGTATSHPCREALLAVDHPRGLVRRVDGHVNWAPNQPGYRERRTDFATVTNRSKFVLCPRGRATSSIRFYETMALGRVPVVIADDWEPPHGIELEAFALRWPETTTDGLIEFLEDHEHDAARMGAEAKRVYNDNFAADVVFDRVGDLLEQLVEADVWSRFPRWGYPPDRRLFRHLAGRARKVVAGVRR